MRFGQSKNTLFELLGIIFLLPICTLCAKCVHAQCKRHQRLVKNHRQNREWLAEKTLVSKRTVDNWITTNRPIPPAKLALIEKLMSGEEEIEFELPPDFEKQLRAMADEAKKL